MKLQMLRSQFMYSFHVTKDKKQLRYRNRHGSGRNYFYFGNSPLYEHRNVILKKL